MSDTLYALLAIAMVLTLVSLLVPLSERLRLPHTVLLAIAGMGLGFFGTWMTSGGHTLGALGDVFLGLDKLEVATDVFLPLFLPPLLFTAGLTIDVRRLFDEVFAVLLMAIVAVLVCIAGVASAVHLATGIDLTVCLLLGAIVSTTDPAAARLTPLDALCQSIVAVPVAETTPAVLARLARGWWRGMALIEGAWTRVAPRARRVNA